MSFMSFPIKLSHFRDPLMGKAKKLSVLERGRIFEMHKQGLPQPSITAEVGHSETFILNFLKDPEAVGTIMSCRRPRKNFTCPEPEDLVGCQ